jgi:2-polyprenyl-3-methyl-5-hydroxy-6-metoxy-1,4-benzoquinol methylase
MSSSDPLRMPASRLQWTRELAEQYWRGTYDADLDAARLTRGSARLVARALAAHLEPGAQVAQLVTRDGSFDAALAEAGYTTSRIDTGPPMVGYDNCLPASPGASTDERVDAVLTTESLSQLINDEVDGCFACVRLALKPGGVLVATVPNSEILDQYLAIDPKTGVLFHMRQHVRAFTPESVENLFNEQGFNVEVLQQLEFSDAAFSGRSDLASILKANPRLHLGNGATLFVIGRYLPRPRIFMRVAGRLAGSVADVLPRRWGLRSRSRAAGTRPRRFDTRQDLIRSRGWLAEFRTATIRADHRPSPRQLQWSPPLIDQFWSFVAGTPLDEMSFGRVNGRHLLQVLSPWLDLEKRYLDYGAGDGSFAEYMLERGFSVATCEPAPARRAMLQARLGRYPNYLGTFTQGNMVPFDCVFAIEVIEHVPAENLSAFLMAVSSALVAGGTLILSTPSNENLAASMVYSPLSGAVFHRWQHLQSWTAERLSDALETHGFTCDSVYDLDFSAAPTAVPDLSPTGARNGRIGKGGTLLANARKRVDAGAIQNLP